MLSPIRQGYPEKLAATKRAYITRLGTTKALEGRLEVKASFPD